VDEIQQQTGSIKGKLVIFFASSKFDLGEVGRSLQKAYSGTDVIGCSTSGEIVSGKVLKNSVVVGILDDNTVADVSVAVIDRIREEDNVGTALGALEKHYGRETAQMDMTRFVGIILFDGLSGAEEKIMDKLGNLTDLIFVGGSAGDDLAFKQTCLYAGGKVHTGAAVMALIETRNGYDIIKTQSFKTLEKVLVANKVDEASRTVLEFNGLSAGEAYAREVGVPVARVAEKFMSNPLGLMVSDEPFVRSPQQLKDDGRMVFYCNIKKDMELNLLESMNIVDDTKKALAGVNGAAGIINFNCILRTLELEAKNQSADYGKLFMKTPTIGFSTYGEAYLGHINQTATMLVLK
jgi:hypothetical protein